MSVLWLNPKLTSSPARFCVSALEDLYNLFMETRTAQTELRLESSVVVEAGSILPWEVPIEGVITLMVCKSAYS